MAKPKFKLGWQRNSSDIRDYHSQHDDIHKLLSPSRPLKTAAEQFPTSVNLRTRCSRTEGRDEFGSCTANAGLGLTEDFPRSALGKHLDASRSFFCTTIRYSRRDPAGTPLHKHLNLIKTSQAANLPWMFGFSVYRSINDASNKPCEIPYLGSRRKTGREATPPQPVTTDAKKIGKTKGPY